MTNTPFPPNNRNGNNQDNHNQDNNQEPEQTPEFAQMGKGMMTIAWVIALGLLTYVFGNWQDDQFNPNQKPQSQRSQNAVEVTLRQNRAGHYMANGSINNKQVTFLLDTGATHVAIPGELQEELNLESGRRHSTQTANGTATAYATRIDKLTLGDIELYDVRASIVPNMQGKEILLGMSVLKQVDFSQKGKQLTLRQQN